MTLRRRQSPILRWWKRGRAPETEEFRGGDSDLALGTEASPEPGRSSSQCPDREIQEATLEAAAETPVGFFFSLLTGRRCLKSIQLSSEAREALPLSTNRPPTLLWVSPTGTRNAGQGAPASRCAGCQKDFSGLALQPTEGSASPGGQVQVPLILRPLPATSHPR